MTPPLRCLLGQSSDLPRDDGWLAPPERAIASRMRVDKRREEYRLGRWTAKRALAACLGPAAPELDAIAILPAPDGAPEVFLRGAPSPLHVSISHARGRALACVGPPDLPFGCDLELVEPRSPEFVHDFFCPEERALVARTPEEARALLVTLIWSAKESALKATRQGLREDTRSVRVSPLDAAPEAGWRRVRVEWVGEEGEPGKRFAGWWREVEGMAVTVAAEGHAGSAPPEEL